MKLVIPLEFSESWVPIPDNASHYVLQITPGFVASQKTVATMDLHWVRCLLGYDFGDLVSAARAHIRNADRSNAALACQPC